MVYHKKKGMKTRKVRNLKRKTRRYKRRVGGRGSLVSSMLGVPDSNQSDSNQSDNKKNNTRRTKRGDKSKKQNGLQPTIKKMREANTPKKRTGSTNNTNQNKTGTRKRKKTSPYTNQQKRSSSDIYESKRGHLSLKHDRLMERVKLNPEPRKAANTPSTNSDDSN